MPTTAAFFIEMSVINPSTEDDRHDLYYLVMMPAVRLLTKGFRTATEAAL